jgi:hypothetical protein
MDEFGSGDLSAAISIWLSNRPGLSRKSNRPSNYLKVSGVDYQVVVIDGTSSADRNYFTGKSIA